MISGDIEGDHALWVKGLAEMNKKSENLIMKLLTELLPNDELLPNEELLPNDELLPNEDCQGI